GRDLFKDVQGNRPHQRLSVSETAIQRGDADSGPRGDLLQRNVDTLLNERVTSSREQPFPVAPRVDPHRPMMTDAPRHPRLDRPPFSTRHYRSMWSVTVPGDNAAAQSTPADDSLRVHSAVLPIARPPSLYASARVWFSRAGRRWRR